MLLPLCIEGLCDAHCMQMYKLMWHALQAGASVIPTTALMLCSYASQLLTAVVSTFTYTLWWVLVALHNDLL